MKIAAVITLASLGFLAACSDPAEPDPTAAYELESMFDMRPPIPQGPLALLSERDVLCADTLYSQVIELTAPATARLLTDLSRRCNDGRPRVRSVGKLIGSYAFAGDSITLIFALERGEFFTSRAGLAGDRLTIGVPVYTEHDPNGSSGDLRYIIFRKR